MLEPNLDNLVVDAIGEAILGMIGNFIQHMWVGRQRNVGNCVENEED